MNAKHKALSTLFRALAEHTSHEKHRTNLQHVRVWRAPGPEKPAAPAAPVPPAGNVDVEFTPDVIRFEATDGYALVRVDVPALFFDDVGFTPDGYYVAKSAATLLSVGSAPITNPDADEFVWPQTDNIVPSETMSPGAACGFDPVLLGSVLDTIAKIAHGFNAKRTDPARIQLGQASVDPCRITRKIVAWFGDYCVAVDVVAVVMPCRL